MWFLDDAKPTCDDCRDLYFDNHDVPPCTSCDIPQEASPLVYSAVKIWLLLDGYSRQIDAMAGNVLPLKLSDIDCECARYADRDGLRRLVLVIEHEYLQIQRRKRKVQG